MEHDGIPNRIKIFKTINAMKDVRRRLEELYRDCHVRDNHDPVYSDGFQKDWRSGYKSSLDLTPRPQDRQEEAF